MKLRNRLLIVAALVLTLLCGGAYTVYRTTKASQLNTIDARLLSAETAVHRLHEEREEGHTEGPGGAAGDLSDVYVAVELADGGFDVLARPRGTTGKPVTTSTNPTSVEDNTGTRWRAIRVTGEDGHRGNLVVAIPLDETVEVLTGLRTTLLAVVAALTAAILLAGWWVNALALRPIRDISRLAGAITNGDRARRIRKFTPGTEAGELAGALNVMLDETAANEERLRRFVADAGHELRSPLTAIVGIGDLHRRGELNDDELSEAMERVMKESRRMARLVEDLLLLSRFDRTGPEVECRKQQTDIAALVNNIVTEARQDHPNVKFTLTGPGALDIPADAHRLEQVFGNLLRNAITHGEGAPVRVEIITGQARDGTGRTVTITVSDDGPGVAPEDLERIFERFWRSDPARSRQSGGSGLGLSIVRSLVEAHGGQVSASSPPGKGLVVAVELPLG